MTTKLLVRAIESNVKLAEKICQDLKELEKKGKVKNLGEVFTTVLKELHTINEMAFHKALQLRRKYVSASELPVQTNNEVKGRESSVSRHPFFFFQIFSENEKTKSSETVNKPLINQHLTSILIFFFFKG